MNTYAAITSIITTDCRIRDSQMEYKKIASSNKLFGELWANYTEFQNYKINKSYDILKKYSKIEILEYLKLLIPIIDDKKCNNLGITIKSLEKEIYGMTDEVKNNYDLINENEKLKHKCEQLQNELDAIIKIVNKK